MTTTDPEREAITPLADAATVNALKGILWGYLGPIEADDEEFGAVADAILATFRRWWPITDAQVEAAARAIYARPSVHGYIEDWDDDSEKVRSDCRAEARAALEAARSAP